MTNRVLFYTNVNQKKTLNLDQPKQSEFLQGTYSPWNSLWEKKWKGMLFFLIFIIV